jgi:DNA repair exonuclease SbcCD nuclease subunit
VRFVHAADLHLAAPFVGVDATDPRVRDALVAAPYEALDAVVELCISSEAHFLVVSGDVYNSAESPLRAELAFRNACARLAEAGIPVYVAHGNHDPANARSFGLEMPETVHVFSATEVERVVFERDGEALCAIYGRSFGTAAERDNLALGFSRDPSDVLAVGVLHTNVGGRPGHEPYAPCSLDDLRAARMDYWALGHIHKPEVLSEDPAIVYAGCTQGLQPNESGARGCRLVTLTQAGATSEFVPTARVIWSQATVDVSGAEDIDALRQLLLEAVDELVGASGGTPAVARLTIEGRSGAHAEVSRPGALADLLSEVRADALARDPWVWVDRIADRTRPALDIEALREGEDLAGDLVRIADALREDPARLEALVAEVSGPLFAVLDRREVTSPDAQSLLERACDLALDRLLHGEES